MGRVRNALLGIFLMSMLGPAQARAAPGRSPEAPVEAPAHGQAEALAGRLARALVAGDHARLSRLGAAAGARGLMPVMGARQDRTERLAAVLAAPAPEDGWAMLVVLAEHAAGPDRPLAVAASQAATSIAARLDRDWESVYSTHDIPEQALARGLEAWREVGADPGRWADVRVHALEVSAHLVAARQRTDARAPHELDALDALDALAADADAEVRRAAFELLPHPLSPREAATAARAATHDTDPAAALAAAQALCGGLAIEAPAAPALAALGPDGLDRLRHLVSDPTLPLAARVDGARCLAADDTPASRQAVRLLQSSLPARIRGQAWRLVPIRR